VFLCFVGVPHERELMQHLSVNVLFIICQILGIRFYCIYNNNLSLDCVHVLVKIVLGFFNNSWRLFIP